MVSQEASREELAGTNEIIYVYYVEEAGEGSGTGLCLICFILGHKNKKCRTKYSRLSRTHGVSIFIDYCTAPRDTEKDGRRGKRHSTNTRE